MKKRDLIFNLLIICVINVYGQFGGGDGSAENPFLISNAQHLNEVRFSSNESCFFEITNNIDLSEWILNNPDADIRENGWKPIDLTISPSHVLTLDGKGFTISGLYINRPDETWVGLFGQIQNCILKNIVISNYDVTGKGEVGGLAGRYMVYNNDIQITNCHASGKVSSIENAGGLIGSTGYTGYSSHSITITNCSAIGEVIGFNNVGGLVGANTAGRNSSRVTLQNCYSSSFVKNKKAANPRIAIMEMPITGSTGGIIGSSEYMTISTCYASGFVTGPGRTGGIAGYNDSSSNVINCVALQQGINGSENIGRIVGSNEGTITQNYALNSILLNGTALVGSGSADGNNGSGRSKEDLLKKSTYEMLNWDFIANWAITEGKGYPYFKTQLPSPVMTDLPVSGMEEFSGEIMSDEIKEVAVSINGKDYRATVTNNTWSVKPDKPLAGYDNIVLTFISGTGNETGSGQVYISHYQGEGNENAPYLIHNPDELDRIRFNHIYCYYSLVNDIDLNEWILTHSESDIRENGWLPLGENLNAYFRGVLDGNGYTIYALRSYRSDTNKYECSNALIDYAAENTVIKNITIENCEVKATGPYQGYAAGLIGRGKGKVTLTNCKVTGTINGFTYAGGLIASGEAVEITDCYVNADIISENGFAGGLGGYTGYSLSGWQEGIISKCQVIAHIYGKTVAGLLTSSAKDIISECNVSGLLQGTDAAAGLVKSASLIKDSYASCVILCTENAVGVAETSDKLYNCYTAGIISGKEVAGILNEGSEFYNNVAIQTYLQSTNTVSRVARQSSNFKGTNNYALESMWVNNELIPDGLNNNHQGESVNYNTLQTAAFYTEKLNWDFNDIWNIETSNSLPYFNNQCPPPVIQTEVKKSVKTIQGSYSTDTTEKILIQINGGEKRMATLTNGNWHYEIEGELSVGDILVIWAEGKDLNPSYAYSYMIPFEEGAGTADDPFIINNAGDLNAIRNMLSAHYELHADIDVKEWLENSVDKNVQLYGWKPIGTSDHPFTGVFNGNNFAIYGLTINRPSESYVGLFGAIGAGQVNNVRVMEADITGGDFTGIIAGNHTGGLVANINDTKGLSNVRASGKVNGGNYTGGLIGCLNGGYGSKVTDCSYTGIINGKDYTGGIAGAIDKSRQTRTQISQNHASAVITGNTYVGGLFGHIYGKAGDQLFNNKATTNISDSYSTGKVSGATYVGGLTGDVIQMTDMSVDEDVTTFDRCYSGCIISASDWAGGLAGEIVGSVTDCVALNPYILAVNGNKYGRITTNSSFFTNNYALQSMLVNRETLSGTKVDNNGEGKPLDDWKKQSTYHSIHWDFDTVWEIHEGQSFPYFKNQLPPPTFENALKPGDKSVQLNQLSGEASKYILIVNGTDFYTGNLVGNSYKVELQRPLRIGDFIFSWTANENEKISYGIFYAINYEEGDGSEGNPYVIRNVDELNAVRNDLSASYKLDNDLDLTDWIHFNEAEDIKNKGWQPIGNKEQPFSGAFYGENHTISGLYINRPDAEYVGLFGYIKSLPFESLTIQDAEVTGGHAVGILAGGMLRNVNNCTASGTVTGKSCVGGLIGMLEYGDNLPARIRYSGFEGTVDGTAYVGGLAGAINREYSAVQQGPYLTTISDSYTKGEITGEMFTGGIIGYIDNEIHSGYFNTPYEVEIARSYSSSMINGNHAAGGILGGVTSKSWATTASLTVKDCYSTGIIKGEYNLGGIIGSHEWGNYIEQNQLTITSSYSSAYVKGEDLVGGLTGSGEYIYISNSLAMNPQITVNVANPQAGRIIGKGGSYLLTNTYGMEELVFSNESTGLIIPIEDTEGVQGLPIAHELLCKQDVYNNLEWDFENIWSIWEGASYPYFNIPVGHRIIYLLRLLRLLRK